MIGYRMLRPLSHPILSDLVPQAILSLSIDTFHQRYRDLIEVGHDDFDAFRGLSFMTDDGRALTIRHYAGHPPETATVYLDADIQDVAAIRAVIATTVRELAIPLDAVTWQRGDEIAMPVAANQ